MSFDGSMKSKSQLIEAACVHMWIYTTLEILGTNASLHS